jgi:hypothetical protein
MPILKELGINKSYSNRDPGLLEFVKQFEPVTEEMILKDIEEYLNKAQD